MVSRATGYGLGVTLGCAVGASAAWLVATEHGRSRLRLITGRRPATEQTHIELPEFLPAEPFGERGEGIAAVREPAASSA